MNDLSRAQPPSEIPDLTACEREPIHSPGAIEPNGAMLVLGQDNLTILQASSNLLPFLNVTPEAALGMRLTDLFSQEVAHQLLSSMKGDGERHYVVGLLATSGISLDALVHKSKGLLIIEFEPAKKPRDRTSMHLSPRRWLNWEAIFPSRICASEWRFAFEASPVSTV